MNAATRGHIAIAGLLSCAFGGAGIGFAAIGPHGWWTVALTLASVLALRLGYKLLDALAALEAASAEKPWPAEENVR